MTTPTTSTDAKGGRSLSGERGRGWRAALYAAAREKRGLPPTPLTATELVTKLRAVADALDAGDGSSWTSLLALNIAEFCAMLEAIDAAKNIEAWLNEAKPRNAAICRIPSKRVIANDPLGGVARCQRWEE